MKLFEANRLIVWKGRVKRMLVRRCFPLLKDLLLMKKGNDFFFDRRKRKPRIAGRPFVIKN